MRRALQIILGIALIGVSFSGYLSYTELFAAEPAASCSPVGPAGSILGYPPCIYGLIMYTVVGIVAAVGLWQPSRAPSPRKLHHAAGAKP